MTFIKHLRSGQASLEYFVLFGIVAAIVFLALTSDNDFLVKIRNSMQGEGGFFEIGAKRIIQGDYYNNSTGVPGGDQNDDIKTPPKYEPDY